MHEEPQHGGRQGATQQQEQCHLLEKVDGENLCRGPVKAKLLFDDESPVGCEG